MKISDHLTNRFYAKLYITKEKNHSKPSLSEFKLIYSQ